MRRSQPVFVGARCFPTKEAAADHFRKILHRGVIDAEADADLRDLLENHAERDLKVGCGIRGFFIGPNGWGKSCFWIDRLDGTRTDFSFLACITPATPQTKAKRGFREAIRPQIQEFKLKAYTSRSVVPCAITGVMVPRVEAHVDHRPPATFSLLLETFCRDESVDIASVRVADTADGITICTLADDDLARRWSDFHRARAVLQITSSKANMMQGRGI